MKKKRGKGVAERVTEYFKISMSFANRIRCSDSVRLFIRALSIEHEVLNPNSAPWYKKPQSYEAARDIFLSPNRASSLISYLTQASSIFAPLALHHKGCGDSWRGGRVQASPFFFLAR